MNAINNSGLLNPIGVIGTGAFAPSGTYAYNSGAATVTVTDTSTYAAGDSLKILHIYITDTDGTVEYKKITAGGGNVVADVSELDLSGGFNINCTVVTAFRYIGDMSAFQIGVNAPTTGSFGGVKTNQESNN